MAARTQARQLRRPGRSPPSTAVVCAPLVVALGLLAAAAADPPDQGRGRVTVLAAEDAWRVLPKTENGACGPLPVWARSLASGLPHTTGAMLELDYLHRVRSPLPSVLRARMRWVAAHALGCASGEADAVTDLLRAGGRADDVRALAGDHQDLPESDRAALAFARSLALAPHAVTDREVGRLVRLYGERQVVAMVLLLAYANFQDRLALALDLSPEPGEPLPPIAVSFRRPPLGTSLAAARTGPAVRTAPASRPASPVPGAVDPLTLTVGLEKQRSARPRVRLPFGGPGVVHWGLVCQTYQPDLAAAWTACRRNFEAEADLDPVFAASLFWVVAQARQSFY